MFSITIRDVFNLRTAFNYSRCLFFRDEISYSDNHCNSADGFFYKIGHEHSVGNGKCNVNINIVGNGECNIYCDSNCISNCDRFCIEHRNGNCISNCVYSINFIDGGNAFAKII